MEEMDKIKDLEVRVQSLKRSVDLLSINIFLIVILIFIDRVIK